MQSITAAIYVEGRLRRFVRIVRLSGLHADVSICGGTTHAINIYGVPCKLKDGPDSDSKLNKFAVPRHRYFRRFYLSETIIHVAHFDNFFLSYVLCRKQSADVAQR